MNCRALLSRLLPPLRISPMASELTIDVNNSVGDPNPKSRHPENLTSTSAVPETQHRAETKTCEDSSGNDAEGQQAAGGVGSGESRGKETGGRGSQDRSREEEDNDRTDREFSETIDRLDSVLLEAGGEMSGGKTSKPVTGGDNLEPLEKASASGRCITLSKGEAQGPVGGKPIQVPLGETPESVGVKTIQVPLGETTESLGGKTIQVPLWESPELVGGKTIQVPLGESPESVGGKTVPLGEICESVGGKTVPASLGENLEFVGDIIVLVSTTETSLQVPEQTSHHVAGEVTDKSMCQVTGPEVTSESDPSPLVAQEQDTRTYENIHPPLAQGDESWIDILVKNIVTEVTTEGVAKILSDSRSEQEEEGAQVTTDREQRRAAVPGTDTEAQVATNSDLTVPVCEETGPLAQVTKDGEQVALGQMRGAEPGTDTEAQVAVQVCEGETGSPAQVSAGRAAESSVTPDPVTVPSREATSDPGQPAACREKEWPPLICTGSEVRADPGEQGLTQPGTVSEREPTPAMKDWETVGEVATPTHETPIEREIRLAMDREMTLRKERGIDVPVGELVEVRRKMVAAEPATLPGKERKLAGAQMQREILLETQREQDLVEQGKVMGSYDRGDQQEVQEKKMIFESMNTEPSDPPFRRKQGDLLKSMSLDSPIVMVPVTPNHVAPTSPSRVKKGPSYAEANGSNIIILEHSSVLQRSAAGVVSSPAPAEPLRSSPAEFRRSTPADLRVSRSSSGSSPVSNAESPGSPFQVLHPPSPRSILEREIEEVQHREQELRRQRTSIYGKDRGTEETPENGEDVQSGGYQPERPSWGRLEVNWPPTRSSAVNGQQEQASESPRTRRQRSTLIQSWESGKPNPRDEE